MKDGPRYLHSCCLRFCLFRSANVNNFFTLQTWSQKQLFIGKYGAAVFSDGAIQIIRGTHGRPQTFFRVRAKFSSWGGGWTKQTICLKNTIFLNKSQKTYYFFRPRGGMGGARAPSCLPLRTPMVALLGPFLTPLPYPSIHLRSRRSNLWTSTSSRLNC